MRRFILLSAYAFATCVACAGFETEGFDEASAEYDRWYVGASGALLLPQGGSDLGRRGGAWFRAGYYFDEFWAVEGAVGPFEHAAGLAADVLWHWWGYERFDPFFTLGAEGFVDRRGQVGPKAGVGAFYHLTDSWSLRFDADLLLGLDRQVEADYVLSAGFQFSF